LQAPPVEQKLAVALWGLGLTVSGWSRKGSDSNEKAANSEENYTKSPENGG
jgi:hypothetical protein